MDIFISYRRDGGESLAYLLYERLKQEGYTVFLDVESLRSGDFNLALYDQIDACTDFLLLLPPGALERCNNPKDWVRLEIEHAIAKKKNIIPVFMRNFELPNDLPPSLSCLPQMNGVKADMELFDGVILKLRNQLLRSQGKTDTKTMYPIQNPRDFPGWYLDYLFRERLEPGIHKESNAYDQARTDFAYYELLRNDIVYSRKTLEVRKQLSNISYAGKYYTVYDIRQD